MHGNEGGLFAQVEAHTMVGLAATSESYGHRESRVVFSICTRRWLYIVHRQTLQPLVRFEYSLEDQGSFDRSKSLGNNLP